MNNERIKLTIPGRSEYIPVARLVVSGLASKIDFDIEEIDDIKVSLAEACINALKLSQTDEINMEFEVKTKQLTIFVSGVKEMGEEERSEFPEVDLGIMIIESLMDQIVFSEKGIEMIKYTGDDSNGND